MGGPSGFDKMVRPEPMERPEHARAINWDDGRGPNGPCVVKV